MTAVDAGEQARVLVAALDRSIQRAFTHLATDCTAAGRVRQDLIDRHQGLAYDLATIASATAAAGHLVALAERDTAAASAALVYAADVAADASGRLAGREAALGLPSPWLGEVAEAITAGRDPRLLHALGGEVVANPVHRFGTLADDLAFVRQNFRRFTEEQVSPIAQQVHCDDADVPEHIIAGVAALGGFGLTVPRTYGGQASGPADLAAMLLATEELSRGSLAIAGSLITRPEIVGAALLLGGTEEQKLRWLPGIASGRRMCAVAVTEPDAGSDVGAIRCSARPHEDGWVLDGVKTWCTFAGRADQLLVLARTDPDRSLRSRGLSLFLVDKAAVAGTQFDLPGPLGGRLVGRAIPTLGYRGLHSFEVSFAGCRVPHDALVGGEQGLGRGFALQMAGFAVARLQTAARAQGVMQSAIELASAHVRDRRAFGAALADLDLTRAKLARMTASLAACRAMTAGVAPLVARRADAGPLASAQAKLVACRAAEWVTREAQQLHGGIGYAQEHPVSRLFVDARVLSIFEGADEVLALRVIARGLCADAQV